MLQLPLKPDIEQEDPVVDKTLGSTINMKPPLGIGLTFVNDIVQFPNKFIPVFTTVIFFEEIIEGTAVIKTVDLSKRQYTELTNDYVVIVTVTASLAYQGFFKVKFDKRIVPGELEGDDVVKFPISS